MDGRKREWGDGLEGMKNEGREKERKDGKKKEWRLARREVGREEEG